jgi:hypothetical protein
MRFASSATASIGKKTASTEFSWCAQFDHALPPESATGRPESVHFAGAAASLRTPEGAQWHFSGLRSLATTSQGAALLEIPARVRWASRQVTFWYRITPAMFRDREDCGRRAARPKGKSAQTAQLGAALDGLRMGGARPGLAVLHNWMYIVPSLESRRNHDGETSGGDWMGFSGRSFE